MGSKVSFSEIINGIECTVVASDFEYDPTTGMEPGPESVVATDEQGREVELTEDQRLMLAYKATEIWLGDNED